MYKSLILMPILMVLNCLNSSVDAVEKFKNIIENGASEISKKGSYNKTKMLNQLKSATPTLEDFTKVTNFFLCKIDTEKLKVFINEVFAKKTSEKSYEYLHDYCEKALDFLEKDYKYVDKIIKDFSNIIPDKLEHLKTKSKKAQQKRKIRLYLRKITGNRLDKKSYKFPDFAEFVNYITQILSIKEDILTYELGIKDKSDLITKQVYTYNLCVLKSISKVYNLLTKKQ